MRPRATETQEGAATAIGVVTGLLCALAGCALGVFGRMRFEKALLGAKRHQTHVAQQRGTAGLMNSQQAPLESASYMPPSS